VSTILLEILLDQIFLFFFKFETKPKFAKKNIQKVLLLMRCRKFYQTMLTIRQDGFSVGKLFCIDIEQISLYKFLANLDPPNRNHTQLTLVKLIETFLVIFNHF